MAFKSKWLERMESLAADLDPKYLEPIKGEVPDDATLVGTVSDDTWLMLGVVNKLLLSANDLATEHNSTGHDHGPACEELLTRIDGMIRDAGDLKKFFWVTLREELPEMIGRVQIFGKQVYKLPEKSDPTSILEVLLSGGLGR